LSVNFCDWINNLLDSNMNQKIRITSMICPVVLFISTFSFRNRMLHIKSKLQPATNFKLVLNSFLDSLQRSQLNLFTGIFMLDNLYLRTIFKDWLQISSQNKNYWLKNLCQNAFWRRSNLMHIWKMIHHQVLGCEGTILLDKTFLW
jgi:hypothetical protein